MTATTGPANSAVEGLWDRRRRLVAAEIEQVALGLFADKGYDNVTTDDIARACGMSVRTFFRYFAAKRDVLLAMPRRSLAYLCDAVEARPADEHLLTAWRLAVVEAIDRGEIDLSLVVRLKAIVLHDPVLVEIMNGDAELTERFVQTNARRLGVDPGDDLRPVVVAGAVRNALIAAMEQWSSGHPEDLARSFSEAFAILAHLETIV
jgi:AcrR family transcriptional regulator